VPSATVAAAGFTAIETRAGAATFNTVEAFSEPELTWIVAVPWNKPAAKPLLLIVATTVGAELQVALPVRSCVLPSVYTPVAVNCCVAPKGIVASDGLRAIDMRVGTVTVNVAEPLTPAALAVIVVVPWAAVAATPAFVASPLIRAVVTEDELHKAEAKDWVLPSLNVPRAVKSCCDPTPIEDVAGVIAILASPFNWLVV